MPSKEEVMKALYEVIDPELEINIIDLGLVYGVETSDDGDVQVIMTLTTPGCPLGDSIERGVENALYKLPDVKHVYVDIVWEPRWSPNMMSEKAKAFLNFQ